MIIALAAVMWFLYLVPTWLRRREYLATERNAVRLQQTMRILAESAEMPSVVRVEATARTVAAQQRALRQQQGHTTSRSARSRLEGSRPATPLPDQAQLTVDAGVRTRRRLRRSRALASLVLLVSLFGVGFGVSAATAGNWLLLAVSIAVGAGSIALLGQAATVTHARADLRRVSMVSASSSTLHDEADYAPERRAGWVPVPVPKPLYLAEQAPSVVSARAHVAAQSRAADPAKQADVPAEFDHAAALRAASAEAERSLRAAQASPEVARIGRPVAEPVAPAAESTVASTAAPSRFASMGVIDPEASNATDLDEILRRRRAVG